MKPNESAALAAHPVRSLHIEGFRGIREGTLDDLTPLVVLVVPNGSGKSTIPDALWMAQTRSLQPLWPMC
jgi:predicted ATPase